VLPIGVFATATQSSSPELIELKFFPQFVRSQAITGNGIQDNYGRAEKVPDGKVKEKRAGSITGGCVRMSNWA
jgi:hypothetical protein